MDCSMLSIIVRLFVCLSLQGREEFVKRQKMGRMASAEEIAAMVVYLASDEVS